MSDTPETDKAHHAVIHGGDRFSFPEHARQMERERDEARKQVRDLLKETTDSKYLAKRLEKEQTEHQATLWLLNEVTQALKRSSTECDELRKELEELRITAPKTWNQLIEEVSSLRALNLALTRDLNAALARDDSLVRDSANEQRRLLAEIHRLRADRVPPFGTPT